MKILLRITTVPISLDKLLGEQLRFMNNHFKVTAISADEQQLQKVAEKYGVHYFHVELTRAITPIQDLKALWKLYCFIKKNKPEIVHTHTPKAGLIGMMAAKLARVPVRMHTVAGLPLMESIGFKRVVLNFVEKLTYYCAKNVYPNSVGLQEFIIQEKFCNPSKLKIIGNGSSNGIDTQFFNSIHFEEEKLEELKLELGITEEDFVFIFVGRLVKDKGINELLAAFKEIQNSKLKTKDSKLLLVGFFEQDLDPLLPETLQEIEQTPNIITTGFQQDVRPYFAISNALVFPSYREGFPNVVMQAGAMGLPSIVTDINGCNEIIVEGENGVIIPPKNSKALSDAMLEMMNNQDFYSKLKSNSRPMIESRYEQSLVWNELLKEYNRLIEKHV